MVRGHRACNSRERRNARPFSLEKEEEEEEEEEGKKEDHQIGMRAVAECRRRNPDAPPHEGVARSDACSLLLV